MSSSADLLSVLDLLLFYTFLRCLSFCLYLFRAAQVLAHVTHSPARFPQITATKGETLPEMFAKPSDRCSLFVQHRMSFLP